MKVRLTFKTPDVVDDAIEQDGLEDYEVEIHKACDKWVRYGEYLTVEVDTEAGTATVLPV